MDTRTKIVATLGPASESPAVLEEMLAAGVDVVRLNLSHGTLAAHVERLHAVRATADRLERVVAVLADLPGPKVRSGQFPAGGVQLVEGSQVELVAGIDDGATSDQSRITVDYPSLVDDLRVGDRIVLGDGAITLEIVEHGATSIRAVVRTGGRVQGRPGVHLPSERLRRFSTTSLQLVSAVNAVANGGVYVAPRLIRSTIDDKGVIWGTPIGDTHRVISESTADTMAKILTDVVCAGTGTRAQVKGISVAGKTGTGYKVQDNGTYVTEDGTRAYFATFVGFLPAADPKVTILVSIDEPNPSSRDRFGGTAAAPVFAKLAQVAIQERGIVPPPGDNGCPPAAS